MSRQVVHPSKRVDRTLQRPSILSTHLMTCLRRWFLAYWIVLLQGLASALPWNVFITGRMDRSPPDFQLSQHVILTCLVYHILIGPSISETEYFNLRARQSPFLPVLAYNFEGINLLTSMAG